jgi:CspA family cold shock protein
MHGAVREFDEEKGLGVVVAPDGQAFPFHCIEIADGTRTIELDQRVAFERLARFGRFQAAAITKI